MYKFCQSNFSKLYVIFNIDDHEMINPHEIMYYTTNHKFFFEAIIFWTLQSIVNEFKENSEYILCILDIDETRCEKNFGV